MNPLIDPLEQIKLKISQDYINEDFLIWYIMYCYEFAENDNTELKNFENHHILQRKIFPEFKNLKSNKWNLAKLPTRNHIIAHYLLAKATNIFDAIHAFNAMNMRTKHIKNKNDISILFEELREESRKKMTGYNNVYDPKNPTICFRVPVTESRYINGELLHCATGRKHTDATKQLMSKNGIKNKIKIHNPKDLTDTCYINKNDLIPEGYSLGDPVCIELAKHRFTEAAHYHNTITGEEFRVKPSDTPPEGAIKGRNPKVINPFTGTAFHKNFKTNEIISTNETSFNMYCGSPTAKNAFIFEGMISFNLDAILKYFPKKMNKSTAHKLIYQKANTKIFHYKAAVEIRDYLLQFTNYDEIPLQILPISEVVDLVTKDNWLQ